MRTRLLNIGISLVAGVFLAFWVLADVGQWARWYSHAHDCFLSRTASCQVATGLLTGIYTLGFLVFPVLAVLLSWLVSRSLSARRDGAIRPTGVVLGSLFLAWLTLSAAMAFGLRVTAPSGPVRLSVMNLVASTSLALSLLAGVAAVLLWRMRPAGRWAGLAYLLISMALALPSLLLFKSPLAQYIGFQALPFLAKALLLAYLLTPQARAALARR